MDSSDEIPLIIKIDILIHELSVKTNILLWFTEGFSIYIGFRVPFHPLVVSGSQTDCPFTFVWIRDL